MRTWSYLHCVEVGHTEKSVICVTNEKYDINKKTSRHNSISKLFFILFNCLTLVRLDENGNVVRTEMIAKHGCGTDMGTIEGRHHNCSEHQDSCFDVDDSTLPSPSPSFVVTNIEVCFCSTDR